MSPYAQVRQGSARIKQEHSSPAYLAQFSPASTTSPYLTDNRDDPSPGFLTPCSEDTVQNVAVNAATLEDLRLRNGFGPSTDCHQEMMPPPSHDQLTMGQSPFHTFDAAYEMSAYGPGTCDINSPATLDFSGAPSLADLSPEWTTLDHFNDHPGF